MELVGVGEGDAFRRIELSDFDFTPQRPALQEIPSLSVRRGSHSGANMSLLPASYLTPSPEEEIVQQNTLTKLAENYYEQQNTNFYRSTPNKDTGLSQMGRKRLMLSPESSPVKSPEKRLRRQRGVDVPLTTELGAYGPRQLVDVIDRLVQLHPGLEEQVKSLLPAPDLKPLEAQLSSLRKNVYCAFPSARWCSSRDSFCYKRVRVHLQAFKKTCIEQCRVLYAAQCWQSVVLYVAMAWRYIHKLPDWDEPSHNTLKSSCFNTLASICLQTLKRAKFEKEVLRTLKKKLEVDRSPNSQLSLCLSFISQELDKLP